MTCFEDSIAADCTPYINISLDPNPPATDVPSSNSHITDLCTQEAIHAFGMQAAFSIGCSGTIKEPIGYPPQFVLVSFLCLVDVFLGCNQDETLEAGLYFR